MEPTETNAISTRPLYGMVPTIHDMSTVSHGYGNITIERIAASLEHLCQAPTQRQREELAYEAFNEALIRLNEKQLGQIKTERIKGHHLISF
tara:strand:+ start:13545 stop:13820 length:276 start_codon:yes stop_codon:yes gene_type:complete